MRKYMTKEVTFTFCKVAKIEVVNGLPSAVMCDDLELLGSVSEDRCLKLVQEKEGSNASIYEYYTYTQTFEMKVSDFIKHAKIKTDSTEPVEEVEAEYEEGYVKEFE